MAYHPAAMTFTDQRFPAPGLRRRRRHAAWISLLVVLFALFVMVGDFSDDKKRDPSESGNSVVTARVVDGEDRLSVRYRHPGTSQTVTVRLKLWSEPEPAVGDEVKIVVGDSPVDVMLVGDRFFPAANSGIYLVAAIIVFSVIGAVAWNELRIRSLSRRRGSATTPMLATVSVGRRRRSAVLNLYSADSTDGSPPRCSVPLAVVPSIGVDTKFQVAVAGRPARLRRCVALVGNDVLWPTGRAGWTASRPLPAGPVRTLDPQSPTSAPTKGLSAAGRGRPAAVFGLLCAAALAFAAVITVLSVRSKDQTEQFLSRAEPAVGVVTGTSDDYMINFKLLDDGRKVTAEDEFFEELPKGMRRGLLVDPDRSNNRALVAGYSYNLAAPIAFSLVPLVIVLVAGGVIVQRRRRVSRAIRSGPWRQFRAVVVGSHGDWLASLFGDSTALVTLLDSSGVPIASLPVGVQLPYVDGSVLTAGPRTVIVAGELVPGESAAIWPSSQDSALAAGPMNLALFSGSSAAASSSAAPVGAPTMVVGGESTGVQSGERIELATYRFRALSELCVFGDRVEVVVPQWFGSERWTIPIDQVGVQDLTQPEPDDLAQGVDEQVFSQPIIVPYLATTSPNSKPTIALYFKSPQRVPPVRWSVSPWLSDWRDSRSDAGLMFDGVTLRTKFPELAAESIVQQGGERVSDSLRWWIRHRSVVHDADTIDQIVKQEKSHRWLLRFRGLAFFVAIAAAWFDSDLEDNRLLAVVITAGAISVVLSVVGWFLERRILRSDSLPKV